MVHSPSLSTRQQQQQQLYYYFAHNITPEEGTFCPSAQTNLLLDRFNYSQNRAVLKVPCCKTFLLLWQQEQFRYLKEGKGRVLLWRWLMLPINSLNSIGIIALD
mmetsp:Transcript_11008/g.18294  ORF Transcript_11008/g.18294 Transcript_11008/m.18294 type:complete len:104 (+) Transcript_11008:83-394(+)